MRYQKSWLLWRSRTSLDLSRAPISSSLISILVHLIDHLAIGSSSKRRYGAAWKENLEISRYWCAKKSAAAQFEYGGKRLWASVPRSEMSTAGLAGAREVWYDRWLKERGSEAKGDLQPFGLSTCVVLQLIKRKSQSEGHGGSPPLQSMSPTRGVCSTRLQLTHRFERCSS